MDGGNVGDRKLETNSSAPPKRDPAALPMPDPAQEPPKIPFPIPWISTEPVFVVPPVRGPTLRWR